MIESNYYFFVSSLSILSFLASSSVNIAKQDTIITFPLLIFNELPPSHPLKTSNLISHSSLTKHRNLKQLSPSHSVSSIPVSFEEYVGYFISLSIGTPPQAIYMLFDTGSSLVWSPCGLSFHCCNEHGHKMDPTRNFTFYPNLSSSSMTLKCKNPKCWWVSHEGQSRCQKCSLLATRTCSQDCPRFEYGYLEGSMIGKLLFEILHLPSQSIHEFLYGCASFSTLHPFGVAGFSYVLPSLPSQVGVTKFSYCLPYTQIHHDQNIESTHTNKITPLHKHNGYYYVVIENIIVGNVSVKVRNKDPRVSTAGWTIVDTGSTYTSLEKSLFEIVVQEFAKQVDNHIQIGRIEIFRSCFQISDETKPDDLPRIIFRFEKGVDLELSWWNYLVQLKDLPVYCLSFLPNVLSDSQGAAIIWGAHSQRNIYMNIDLKRETVGFRSKDCARNGVVTIVI